MKNPVSHESLKRTRDTRLIFSSWTLLDSFLIIMDASLLLRRDLIRQTVSALLCSLILFCRKWSLEEMRSLSRFFLSLSFFQRRIRKGEWVLFTTTVVVLRTRKETMNKMYTQMQRRNLRSDCDVKGQTGRRREWMRGPNMIKGSWRFGVLSLKALSLLLNSTQRRHQASNLIQCSSLGNEKERSGPSRLPQSSVVVKVEAPKARILTTGESLYSR